MYLSRIILNTASFETRRLILSPYKLHKAIFRAFPDQSEGGPGRVLYRLDENGSNDEQRFGLLVQSEKEPDWNKAVLLTGCSINYESKTVVFNFVRGQICAFRLRANPTVKKLINNKPVRLGLVKEPDQLGWLQRKGEGSGFTVLDCAVIPEGMIKDDKVGTNGTNSFSLLAVLFEGKLKITEPELFANTIKQGIGSGKGFGFGLLSLAPVTG